MIEHDDAQTDAKNDGKDECGAKHGKMLNGADA